MVEPSLFPQKSPADGSGPNKPTVAPKAPKKEILAQQEAVRTATARVNEVASRLAVLEERVANLRKNSRIGEKSLISYDQDTKSSLKALHERLTGLARKVSEVHEKINVMSAEFSTIAKKHELQVLERYLDLWQPLSFMTREEAKLLIKEVLEGGKKSK